MNISFFFFTRNTLLGALFSLAPVFLQASEDRAPADSLTGSPFVSADAWGIFDRATGRQLWGENVETPLSIASTTKIMTALLAIREIEEDPSLLDIEVTFSERAGGTPGSGSKIEAGETVIVADLLYGLLLPSGNDASVALAESFGRRYLDRAAYAEAGASDEEDALNKAAYDAFVARMNETARELNMVQTSFANTHGLDAEGHESTVSDLARLTLETLRSPLFCEIIKTRRHTAEIGMVDGGTREAVWGNTNRLLGTEGFSGVKTGTTRRAGACLVSLGERGDDRLLMVVLGSASSSVRYVDSQNLYRFAWLELGHDPVR